MNWKSIIWCVFVVMGVSCDDVYEGEERYVIEGRLLEGTEIAANEKVELFSAKADAYKEETGIYHEPPTELTHEKDYPVFSIVLSDSNGNFRFGFPGGEDWVFYIKVKGKFYGYVSWRNTTDFYYNFGDLPIN